MSTPNVSRRRKFLINPEFQLRFLGYVLGIAVITILVFFVAKLVFFQQVQQYLLSIGMPPEHMVFRFISKQSVRMNWIFAAAALIESTLLTVWGLMISNRIAGPLYRLHREMISIADGSKNRIVSVREKDFFQEMAQAFNQVLKKM